MAFTNIISGTIGGNGNIISADASFSSILSKFQVRYNGTGSWLECSNTNNITGKSNCSFELKLKDGETLTTMQEMFWNCSSLTSLDLSNLDTSSVTNMQSVFNNCSSLTSLNVSNFNTSQVTTMNSMFFNCSSLISLDLSSFNTSQVTNMLSMFQNCSSLTTLDLSSFNTSQVTIIHDMFYNCPVSNIRLLYATSSTINSLVTQLGVSVARDVYYAITILSELKVQNNITYIKFIISVIAKYKFNPSVYADYLPNFDSQFTGYTKTDVDNGDGTITRTISHDTLKPTIMRFGNTSSITDREKSLLEIIECDTSNITNMIHMFYNCTSLTILNASSFNTSNVTNMGAMFFNCNKLTSLDLSNWNTSKVTNMGGMFQDCPTLSTLDLSNFDTSKVTDMNFMFNGCNKLISLDLSNFNTGEVTSMSYMFNNCSSLTTLDVSNFDTSKVSNMSNMFRNCNKLTSLDLSNFDTSEVTDMYYMFDSCSSLISLDLSNFNTNKVTKMNNTFYNCPVSDIGLIYASSSTINSLLTQLGTDVARNIYYMDTPLSELTVQDNITYIKYELSQATFPYTLNKLPNGVADYIDVVNKVHVQRVGKFIANGTEAWRIGTYANASINDQCTIFTTSIKDKKDRYNYTSLCDKWTLNNTEITTIANIEGIHGGGNNDSFFINVSNSKATTIEQWRTYLQSNPFTYMYELATPIYTPLTNEEIAQLPLSAYKDGYINLSSDQLMPSFEFRMKASNRYQVDMLETGYYYLNAPVGNVKLGTANVDVQQMPCIVKVDNVGTGDSGYRLGLVGLVNNIQLFDRDFNSTFGKWLELSNGELMGVNNPEDAYTDYIEVSPTSRITVTSSSDASGLNKINVVQYDKDKTFISGVTSPGESLTISVNLNVRTKYIRVSYRVPESSYNSGINTINIKQSFPPITLAKLPSHRIPTTFTQGMKCGTDFGYWEGIIGARPLSFRTVNNSTIVEEIPLTITELNRIEYGNTIVEDELDIATGKLIKHIGKVVLDGSDNEIWSLNKSLGDGSYNQFVFLSTINAKKVTLQLVVCDKLASNTDENLNNVIWIYDGTTIVIHSGCVNVDELKSWLQQNPITIYYELGVPEISYPNISLPQVKTVANTALQCGHRNGYLNPQVKPSHLTYPVPSLVGNRTYTVVHNRKNITGSTKPIELNLGGTVVQLNDASSKTLVKTPSTLAHSNLIFIGGESTVDHIMVLDGDWTNKPIEYFENMKGHDTDAIITIIGDGKIDDVAEQYLW